MRTKNRPRGRNTKQTTVHDCIAHQAQIVAHLRRDWVTHEAPDLASLLRAAVEQARQNPRRKTVSYKGKRYGLLISSLGRVIVFDKRGNPLASSNFGEV